MRGILLSTFRLGLSKQASDHKAIDYKAMRDQLAQQATALWELVPGKDLSRKLDISCLTSFIMKNVLPFPQTLGGSWSSLYYVSSLNWSSSTNHGWARGVKVGMELPCRRATDQAWSLSQPLLGTALGSGRFNMILVFPTHVIPEGDQVSHNLQAN